MKIIKELKLKIGNEDKIIYFGIPNDKKELEEMYRLRYRVYSSRGYIDPKRFPDGLEKDEYDFSHKCVYFVAKIDNKIIGTIRLIKDQLLPTEKECFEFRKPEDIEKIPPDKRVELGRLIVVPYDSKTYFPRNLVTLFLISCLVDYGLNNNILGGYAFIKNNLRIKLQKLKTPIHLIKNYTQIYPKTGVLYGYFNQNNNKVIPIYFITDEFKKYVERVINNSLMFKKIDDKRYILKENFYNKFLRITKLL